MRVTKGDTRDDRKGAPRSFERKANTSRSRPRSNVILQVGLLFLACALGFFIHQQGWHRPLGAFAVSLAQRPAFTIIALFHRSDLPTLHVDVRFEDYQRLLDKRSQAHRLGGNIASEQDYVPASVGYAGANVVVQMRLLEGPAEVLSGEAWPFEVAVQPPPPLQGEGRGRGLDLRRFTLVPADETVLSTWGYLETLRQAGLLSPRYYLVRLVLNGSPRGIYALEEQPATESLIAQGRPESVFVYFDQSAYWEAYARLGGALAGNGFQYAQIAVDCTPPFSHPYTSTLTTCEDAVRKLQALQDGECVPSDVLDVDKVSTFLALTTLWRGTSTLDWRTVRLAYDPVTARFEPIGAGTILAPTSVSPLPDRFTDDPMIQMAYARALAQFSHPDYLAQLQATVFTSPEDDLETLRQLLGAEMGYLELPWAMLKAHQAVMRHQIAPSRTLFARVEAGDTALVLRLSNIQPFPVEIVGLDIGENASLPITPTWVVESDRESLVDVPDAVVLRAAVASTPRHIRLRVPPEALPRDHEWDWRTLGTIRVITRLFGLTSQNILVIAEQWPITNEQ